MRALAQLQRIGVCLSQQTSVSLLASLHLVKVLDVRLEPNLTDAAPCPNVRF
jgi:hypothetical protein